MKTANLALPTPAPSLKVQLARAERLRVWKAFLLVAPLLAFLLFAFLIPIAGMLWRSVEDNELSQVLPRTVSAIKQWDGKGLPDESAYAALAADLATAREAGTLGPAAKRLNYDINGYRSLVMNSARRVPAAGTASFKDAFIALDPHWGERNYWAAIKRAAGPLTTFYLLAALDRERDADGSIIRAPAETAIYVDVLARTFIVSFAVTLLCLVLGFPLAYLLATVPTRIGNLLLILVLLPFWTSLLVRTTAWIVLLQNEGILNGAMIWLGVIDKPVRMIFNRFGVYVAMTHVLLPFMILPLYSVMQAIKPAHMRAALSLGAPPVEAFVRVYLPQTLPGVGAGCLLVFILAIGYYITPTLVGGASDQMISYFIAFYTTDTANWGMASALGTVLLVSTLVLYTVYNRLVGTEGVRLG